MFRHLRAALILLLLAKADGVVACTLVAGGNVDSFYASASEVVMAEVISGHRTAQSGDPSADYPEETIRFKVLISWKGRYKIGSTLASKTAIGPGSCGLSIDPTLRLLVRTPQTDLPTGSIWVLFLDSPAPHELFYGGGNARVGDGGEKLLQRLYELSSKRLRR